MLVERENPNRTEYLLNVPEGQHTDVRLDKYITSFVQNASRNKVQKAIKDGHVLVNGKLEKSSYIMQPGDKIEISLPKPPAPEAKPEDIPINIVYEDDELLVVNKEAGMVVHPAFGNWSGTMVNGLLYHADTLSKDDEETLRPGIVHRLDKDTSGLLVVAKNEVAHKKLAKQFAKKSVERTYWAIVWGNPPDSGTIEGNVGRSPRDRKIMTVLKEKKGKSAVTHFETIERFDHLALLKINLETGRTHQIRVHMQHEHFYVFGDPTYGGNSVRYGPNTGSRKAMFNNLFSKLERQALHAKTLGFIHPGSEEYVEFNSELPEDFQFVLDTLRTNCKP
ncbi:RluA family pseudouridine synthase [Rhodohalobacter sp.]|uniref:RluA family pseudouridine synthase n=1 Tax=Rhodohalobacter sp. TaxID=1974210 RepID=UPI002ACF0932|nr:RluA family pseudouridine synthase [Rhodohalobacter sp.]MDZ7758154.1 RluA family pseudouridine synthase [Rhodohalobacter sp.]